jgi:hypothetical protein
MVNHYPGSQFQVRIEISSLNTPYNRKILGSERRYLAPNVQLGLVGAWFGCSPDLKVVLEYAAIDPGTKGESSLLIEPPPELVTAADLSKWPRITHVGSSIHRMYGGCNDLQCNCTDTPLGPRIPTTTLIKALRMSLL